ncbi:iron chaperone [Pseudarthrobacter sp. Y6]|uniref:iron chaperone n=1 Tax=Pseudarthrobacter sp. Y6 TaxID=3418422 RepID=UPI003CF5260C
MGTVDDSLADLPEPDRGCLLRVVDTVRTLVPEAVEGMSYGMPALKLEGRPPLGVVAAAKHLSVFPFSPAVIDAVAHRLEGYSLPKGTFPFTPEHPLPDDVLEDIVRLRRAEIQK